MKKISLFILASFLLVACGAYKYLDLGMLTTGMTVAEVENLMGPPNRVLAVNKKDGYVQEVLEYRTARDEVYALEFWDNYLTGYEYLYDDVTYIPPVAPPMIFPDYGRPIYIYPPDHHHRTVRTSLTVPVRIARSPIDQVARSPTDPARIVPNRIGQAVRKPIVRRQNLRKLPVRRIAEQVTVRNSIEIQRIVSQKRMTDQIQTEGMGDVDSY